MSNVLPEKFRQERQRLVDEAWEIGASYDGSYKYDGCKQPDGRRREQDKRWKLNDDVKNLTIRYYQDLRTARHIGGSRLVASKMKEYMDLYKKENSVKSDYVYKLLYPDEEGATGSGSVSISKAKVSGAAIESLLIKNLLQRINKEKEVTYSDVSFKDIKRQKELQRHPKYPFLAGEPDGILVSPDESLCLLEIKSTESPTQIIQEGELVTTHTTYYQTAAMMEIMNYDKCLVLVTTDDGKTVKSSAVLKRREVKFDDAVMPALKDLYVRWILPELIHPMLNAGRGNVTIPRTEPLPINWVDLPDL